MADDDSSSSRTKPGTKTRKTSQVISTFPPNPLTTTFTAPRDCTGVYESIIWMIDQPTSCLPSSFDPASTAYYSPGIACPAGYTTACHDTRGVQTITTVTCCPYRQNLSLSCVADPLALSDIWETIFCTWTPAAGQVESVDVTLSSNGVTSTSVEVFSAGGGVNAFGVRMVYQSSDVPDASTSSSGSASATGPTSNAASTTRGGGVSPGTGTSTPTPEPAAGGGGLSTGAKAAIGIVVPLVVLGILAAAFFWWRRRRSQMYKAVEMAGSPRGDHKQRLPYAGNNPVYELGTPQPELPGDGVRSELPGHR